MTRPGLRACGAENQPKQVHDVVSLPRHRASRGRGRAIDENSKLQAVCPRLHGGIKSKQEENHRRMPHGETLPQSVINGTQEGQGLMRTVRDFGNATE